MNFSSRRHFESEMLSSYRSPCHLSQMEIYQIRYHFWILWRYKSGWYIIKYSMMGFVNLTNQIKISIGIQEWHFICKVISLISLFLFDFYSMYTRILVKINTPPSLKNSDWSIFVDSVIFSSITC